MATKKHEPWLLLITASCALFAGQSVAFSFDSVSAREFISACGDLNSAPTVDTESEKVSEVNLCQAYLQGYFAGTDEVVAEERLPSSYTLRALRTRGRRLSDEHQQLLNRVYCISEKETLLNFAEKVALLENDFSADAAASEVVQFVLEQNYLCDRDNSE